MHCRHSAGRIASACERAERRQCDQLYLALRIATIEDFAARTTPLPFIVDDILMSFDDARTEAAFRLLNEFAHTTQVIVFTHHAHVVDCGRKAVAQDLQVLEL